MKTLELCRFALVASFLCADLGDAPPAAATPDQMSAAESAVLQTDGPRAEQLYAELVARPDGLTQWEKRQTACSLARLRDKPSIPQAALSGDPLADSIVKSYREYWTQAIDARARAQAEDRLFVKLGSLVGHRNAKDRDAILTAVSDTLDSRNIYTSLGKTAALYDLLLYLREDEREYDVDLNDGTTKKVKVFLMRNMVSYGWARFLTCDGPGTGGFATDKGLYAVRDKYDLAGEDFQINFLAHESRHYADYQRFPGLEGPELEFRAKLTELSKAQTSLLETLGRFEADQSDDRGNPHSYANKRVLAAMRVQLGLPVGGDIKQVQPNDIRSAARTLILKDNAERDAKSRNAGA